MTTASHSTSSPNNGVDVLAIDDNRNNLLLLCGMLKERGFRVRPATSGKLGLQAAKFMPPDVILLDVNMPDMDGYEVCRELKQSEVLKQIPVIFLSALGESMDKLRAFESGGFDYITKPFKVEEVAARIDTQVTIRRLRQDLQKRYEELQEAEQLRDKLVNLIVHDLRNPLGVVLTSLDYILYRNNLNSSDAQLLDSALGQANLMNGMIDDMLDIGRLEGNKMPIKAAEQDIPAVLEEARASVALRGQRLMLDLFAAPGTAVFDRELVRRVLTNLIGNAAKFTPEGGTIQISVKEAAEGTRFEVRDSGPGIPAEYHERIFEKFGRVEAAQSLKGRSTGLGLTFCRLAVEAHGGRIGVESEVGQGSLFWFTLPKQRASLSEAA